MSLFSILAHNQFPSFAPHQLHLSLFPTRLLCLSGFSNQFHREKESSIWNPTSLELNLQLNSPLLECLCCPFIWLSRLTSTPPFFGVLYARDKKCSDDRYIYILNLQFFNFQSGLSHSVHCIEAWSIWTHTKLISVHASSLFIVTTVPFNATHAVRHFLWTYSFNTMHSAKNSKDTNVRQSAVSSTTRQ